MGDLAEFEDLEFDAKFLQNRNLRATGRQRRIRESVNTGRSCRDLNQTVIVDLVPYVEAPGTLIESITTLGIRR